MSHEQDDDPSSDGPRKQTRGRSDERDSGSAADNSATPPNQREDDSRVSPQDGTVGDQIDSADEAIEAEIVDPRPGGQIRSIVSEWSGNLPHPDDAERYERISAGALDRMISLNERRMAVVEHEVRISEKRQDTVRLAVEAEADVKRALATADTGALQRGQWLSWSISLVALVAVIIGLLLGHPIALWGIVVPIAQTGASLVRTVTQARRDGDDGGQKTAPPSDE